MKDNFLKLGILGGRDVLFDTSIFSFYFLIKHVSRKVFTMATDGKKMKYYFQTAYFFINVIIGHGSLYTEPQNLYPLSFSNLFTNLREKLGYHSNEIGKIEYFLSCCFLSPKNDFVWEIIEYMICIVSNNVKFSSISG